ncbi:MAG TPA: ElyC/SanA/YdcF family protein [Candidatus Eisenbacteria bacterium]|nr:ElyC/SanA/YdcF family protein [Candidatus Eisenbacteria bacterium]
MAAAPDAAPRPGASPLSRLLAGLADLLDRSVSPAPSDALFCFAGRPERAPYAVALWRAGIAPVLILSVGRFEWRRFPGLGLDSDGGLRDLVERTPPSRRHFLVVVDRAGARAEWMPRGRLGTLAEARAIARLARGRGWRTLTAVTTAAHSRRALLSVRRALSGEPVRVAVAAVPESRSSAPRDAWWRDRAGRSLVLGECIKLPVYALLARGG